MMHRERFLFSGGEFAALECADPYGRCAGRPSVFWPQPQVDSAIVLIRPNAAERAHVGDVARFRNFLRDLVRAPPQESPQRPRVTERMMQEISYLH
jgi:hypothetical protein